MPERFVQVRQRRMVLLIIMTGLIMGIVAGAGIVSARVAEGHWASSDKVAVIGDVIAGATLLLTVAAGLVALLAYAVSTGAPDLRLKLGSDGNWLRWPSIRLKMGEDLHSPRDYELIVLLKNVSSYSARNPVVTVRVKGLTFLDIESGTWETIEHNVFRPDEGLAVQWEGGADYSVHGHSTRKLPSLRFKQLTCRSRDPFEPREPGRAYRKQTFPAFEFEILAEGYRRVVTVRIAIKRGSLRPEVIFTGDQWGDWI